MNNLIGLFDLDNTLVNYNKGLIESLNKLKHPTEKKYTSPIPVTKFNKERIKLIRNIPGWWKNLERLQLGFDIYNLSEELGFQSYILTRGPENISHAWGEKHAWAKRELPKSKIIESEEKSLVYGRFLVDDTPKFQKLWLEYRKNGIGIVPAHKHNEGFTHPRVVRYDGTNLDEVKEQLIWARDRKQS